MTGEQKGNVERDILEALPDWIYLKDQEGYFVIANSALARSWGFDNASDLIGKHDRDLFTPEVAQAFREAEIDIMRNGETVTLTQAYTRPDGSSGWAFNIKIPYIDETGRAMGLIGFGRDVTSVMALEEQAKLANRDNELYRRVIDEMPTPIFAKDLSCRFIMANPATARLMNAASSGDLIGKTDFDFWPEHLARRFYRDEQAFLARPGHFQVEQPRPGDDGGPATVLISTRVPFKDANGQMIGFIGHNQDITDLRAAETRIKQRESDLRQARWLAGLCSWTLSQGRVELDGPPELVAAFGLSDNDLKVSVTKFYRSVHKDDQPRLRDAFRKAMSDRVQQTIKFRLGRSGPAPQWIESAVSFESAANGQPMWSGIFQDISARVEAREALERQAFTDSLTGLANRAAFENGLVEGAREAAGTGHTVLLADLDHFRDINDNFGFDIGDQLLRQAAARICSVANGCRLVARLNGDEFGCLVENGANGPEARDTAWAIVEAFREPFEIGGHDILISTSVGLSCHSGACEEIGNGSAQGLMNTADHALALAKRRGRDGVVEFDRTQKTAPRSEAALTTRLSRAIAANALDVHFQPILRADTQRIIAFEALARWTDPALGAVSPGRFIPAAEASSLIGRLGALVLRKACGQVATWRQSGYPDMRVSVNVSPAQLWHMDLAGAVRSNLKSFGLDPGALILELTESIFLEHEDRTMLRLLNELDSLGVELALDDFGTGFASMAYLRELPFRKLKIDRCFVDGTSGSSSAERLLSGMIGMAQALEMDVVAEGVERREDAILLDKLNCDAMQGFLFARPLPENEALIFLQTNRGTDRSSAQPRKQDRLPIV